MEGFTRNVLNSVLADLRKTRPGIKSSMAGLTCSRMKPGKHYYFFQFRQNGFPPFDWEGTAHDSYDARAKAWTAYMEKTSETAP